MSIVYLLNGGGESGTSDFQDASGKNHTISVDGGSVYSDTQQVFPPDTSVYKAAGSRIYTPDSDDFDFADSDFGFEFFAHYTTYASNGCLVSKWYRGDYTDNSFALYLPSAAVLQLALWYTDDSSAAVNVSISTGAWIHWSINRVGNTVTVYKDGAVAGTIDVTGKAIKKSTQPVSIGAFFGNNYNGAAFYFDSLVISNGAALRSEPFAPPTTRPTYITFFEYFFSFDIRSLTEQFYDFRTIPAPVVQATYAFLVRNAIKYESDYPFDLDRARQFETDYSFDLIAYKLYQALYKFTVKAGQVFTEADYLFKVLFRNNELYEEQYSLWLNGLIDNFSVQAGLSVVVDGVQLDCISIAGGRNGYYNLYRVVVPDDQRFDSLGLGGEAMLTWHSARLQGDTVVPVLDKQIPLIYKQASVSASASDQGDVRTATLDLVSKTAMLDRLPAPLLGSDPVATVWAAGTLASEVLDDLCLPYLPYTLEYGDYPLLQELDGGQRYPIEIINELYQLADIGPDSDGHLLIKPKLSKSWDELAAPGFNDYDLVLPESEYAIDIQQDYPTTPLYNAVTVRNVAEADSVIFPAPTIIQDEDDPSKATVYGYRYPWVPFDLITCNTACGNVQIPCGSEEIVEVTESLEFEGGKASFPLPVYEFVSVDWGCNRSLGTITASGDGSLQAAVTEWSAGDVTCKVRRRVFLVTGYNGRPNDIKFRLIDEDHG